MQIWIIYAILSAFFASLVAIFGKIGIKGINSNLAVAIRTVVIVFFCLGDCACGKRNPRAQNLVKAYLDIYYFVRYCHWPFLAVLL